jgi:dTDP-4-amino-4,6-dideoxygalactose transaminase
MEVAFFDLTRRDQEMGSEFRSAIDAVLKSGQFIAGPAVEDFEYAFADYIGVRHCIATSNGLDALRLILQGIGIGPGDEVLVPAQTFVATWLAVSQLGGVPVAVDVTSAGLLDPTQIAQRVSNRTRAVIPVHLYGSPCDMDLIHDVLHGSGIAVIEDAAQAHGALYKGRSVGGLGTAAAFSFYPTKNLGALGDAGAITTDDDELAAVLRSLRSYGAGQDKYDHVRGGWNCRMDPIQAAVLQTQLKRLDEWNMRRQEFAQVYDAALIEIAPTALHRVTSVSAPGSIPVNHLYVVAGAERDQFRQGLATLGIQTDVHYPSAPYRLPIFSNRGSESPKLVRMPEADKLAAQCVSLPLHPWMRAEEVEAVAQAVVLTA